MKSPRSLNRPLSSSRSSLSSLNCRLSFDASTTNSSVLVRSARGSPGVKRPQWSFSAARCCSTSRRRFSLETNSLRIAGSCSPRACSARRLSSRSRSVCSSFGATFRQHLRHAADDAASPAITVCSRSDARANSSSRATASAFTLDCQSRAIPIAGGHSPRLDSRFPLRFKVGDIRALDLHEGPG